MQNNGYYAFQGHSRPSISILIESPFRSYRRLLFKFRTLCVLGPLWGHRATYDVYLRLIGKRVVDFQLVIGLIELFYAKCYG